MKPNITAYGRSDSGLVRPHNEDYWGWDLDHHFFVLADGMGGHKAGEVAAKRAVEELCLEVKNIFDHSSDEEESVREFADDLYGAIARVNHSVFDLGCSAESLHGMGTTLCALLVHEKGIVYAHVGDSRIYRHRRGCLKLLTKDHSLLSEMLDLGKIEEHEAEDFMYRNIITKAIGTDPTVKPAVDIDAIEDEDIYLLCSDGLSDLVSNNEIDEILNRKSSIEERADQLIMLANEKGGYDNITVLLLKVAFDGKEI